MIQQNENSEISFQGESLVLEQKRTIYDQTKAKLRIRLNELGEKHHITNKSALARGLTLEVVSVQEQINKQKNQIETRSQENIRELIQYIYENSAILLGIDKDPSIPDNVSVIFYEGKYVINKVLEIKSSDFSQESGLNKNQPEKTIKNIESVVDLLNRIIKTPKDRIHDIKPEKEIVSNKKQERNNLLTKIKALVSQNGLKEEVTFSDKLEYVVIKPSNKKSIRNRDVTIPIIKLSTGQEVSYAEDFSVFSSKDIQSIIENYCETN